MRLRLTIIATAILCLSVTGTALAREANEWQRYGPRERSEALRNYEQHRQLPRERRRDIERQYERWRGMPNEEKDRVRRNYERFQNLTPEERQQFERKYEKWRERRD